MLSVIKFFTLQLCVLTFALNMSQKVVHAEQRPITITWEYSAAAEYFILYHESIEVCNSSALPPGTYQMDCQIDLQPPTMTFTLVAVDGQGVESPHSAPYILNIPAMDSYGNYLPEANLQALPTSGEAPFTVSFDSSSSWDLDGTILFHEWDFGDGDQASGATQSHTFFTPGLYTVTLTITDDAGAVKSKTIDIHVTDPASSAVNAPPVAAFTATTIDAESALIDFDASASQDSDGMVAGYNWNFGDGETASGQYVEHIFQNPGDYLVTLTIFDDEGASDQDQMLVTIVDQPANLPPIAVIQTAQDKKMLTASFEYDNASHPNLAGFNFYINDAFVCTTDDPLARQLSCLSYLESGLVDFYVTAFDALGEESTISEILSLDTSGLVASATGGQAPLTVFFNGNRSRDVDGTLVEYAWNFGDGTTTLSPSAEHTFQNAGTYTINLTVTDDQGESAASELTLIVTPQDNTPPTAADTQLSTEENVALQAMLSASDPDGDPLTFSLLSTGSKGTVTLENQATGAFSYVPQKDATGIDTFTFKATDGLDDSNIATVTIDILAVNSPPISFDQNLSIEEDASLSGTLEAVDNDGDALSFIVVNQPEHGTVSLGIQNVMSSRPFVYTPNADFNGSDAFTFMVSDGTASSLAQINIAILPVNDAPIAALQTSIMTGISERLIHAEWEYPASPDLAGFRLYINSELACETGNPLLRRLDCTVEVSGPSLEIAITAFNIDGAETMPQSIATTITENTLIQSDLDGLAPLQVHLEATGSSDPDGDNLNYWWDMGDGTTSLGAIADHIYANAGDYLVTLTVDDGQGATDTATAPVNVTAAAPANNPPTAFEANITTQEDTPFSGLLTGSDPDGDNLTFTITTPPTHGSIVLGSQTEPASLPYIYTPEANFNGADSFTFSVNDGSASATAAVSITVQAVNDPPAAFEHNITTQEETPFSGMLTGSDPDGDNLTFTITTPPAHGSIVLGSQTGPDSLPYIYTPEVNFSGADSFTFSVNDGSTETTAVVFITVQAVNDPPAAFEDNITTQEETPFSGMLTGSDPDGDNLTFTITTPPAHGSIVLGSQTGPDSLPYIYTPEANFSGADSFTFSINDGSTTVSASVVIQVEASNQAPIAIGAAYTTGKNTELTGMLSAMDNDGDSLSYSVVANPEGRVKIDADTGTFTYNPKRNKTGMDTFQFLVNDGQSDSNIATVTIMVQ